MVIWIRESVMKSSADVENTVLEKKLLKASGIWKEETPDII